MALQETQSAVAAIKRARQILVVTSPRPTIDAMMAAFVMHDFLESLQKPHDVHIPDWNAQYAPDFVESKAVIQPTLGSMRTTHVRVPVGTTPISELFYGVKEGVLDITLVPKTGAWSSDDVQIEAGVDRYDLVIAIGVPDRASLGEWSQRESEFLHQTPIITLDHRTSNEYWGQMNLIDTTCVSTTEVLFEWLAKMQEPTPLSASMATMLLAGMLAATKGFRTGNVTPRALTTSSELINMGADRERVVHSLWRTKSLNNLKLWGRALARLEADPAHALVWTVVSESDLLETFAEEDTLNALVDELISNAPDAKVTIIFVERPDRVTARVYTQIPLNASELVRPLNGAGTRESASAELSKADTTLQNVITHALERVKQSLQKP